MLCIYIVIFITYIYIHYTVVTHNLYLQNGTQEVVNHITCLETYQRKYQSQVGSSHISSETTKL